MSFAPFVFGNKPPNVTTHLSEPHLPGYQEWLAHHLQKKLFVCHRLDRETSGALVFATNSEAAALLTEEFTQGRVEKEYVFVTDKTPKSQSWTCTDAITSSKTNKLQTAETFFEVAHQQGSFYVIRAVPKTGRTHQIRIHAANSGVALLGDIKYGGSKYPQFFLHCVRIQVPALAIDHTTALPHVLRDPTLLSDSLLAQWLTSLDRRERLYGDDIPLSSYRWIHDEGTPLRLDMLGKKGCAGWWRETPPSPLETQSLNTFFNIIKCTEWRLMHYSGQRLQDKPLHDSIATAEWMGMEKNLKLVFKKESGLSCGLFLDQRENRQWVQNQSQGKTVLNLFAYTGAFSVAAALGGASKVTTVDLSKNYIEWCKENFISNALKIEDHGFYAMDSMDYLNYAQKKQMQFDVVICDPPSFSRDKKGNVFRIEKDFTALISAISAVLSPNGILLFSTNYEKWTTQRWKSELLKCTSAEHLEITEKISFAWDFETSHDRHMKAFLLQKK